MNIRDIPITAKLMLLRAGARNFKSIGKEMVINLTESSNLLCIANENGAGKSTLRKECIFYAMTGKTSHKGEGVDSLVNSDVFKNMKVFLEFHFAGQYYRIDRGRKPKLFSISKLSDQDEWVEIENLPVS
ncbi:MAG: AAA family ATPase, partial [Colwellia sp.]|nr:AAA family ATPase [Colwellia sp.]